MGEIRVGDKDAMFGGRGHVQVRQAPADDGDQLQVGQPLDETARKRHPLAHGAHDVEREQCLRGFRLGKMPVEDGYFGSALHRRPVGELEGHAGVIVEYRHPG
jgi:hypothetical protein